MKQDVKEFLQACIHCIISKNSDRIPRPLATALHGEKTNEVVHAVFLYMGPSNCDDLAYVLLIKDDLSSYTWLCPCPSADSEAATKAIAIWIACSGSMQWLGTYQSSHLTASLSSSLTNKTRIRHHLTTVYCPWANETIERMCKEVLRVVLTFLSEWKLPTMQWPSKIETIQKAINLLRLRGRNGARNLRCIMEMFTGFTPSSHHHYYYIPCR